MTRSHDANIYICLAIWRAKCQLASLFAWTTYDSFNEILKRKRQGRLVMLTCTTNLLLASALAVSSSNNDKVNLTAALHCDQAFIPLY